MKLNLRVCSVLIVGTVLVACTQGPQPSVSPVGSWQGTLTTTEEGSGTESFTAEVDDEGNLYRGAFTVGPAVYEVYGEYIGSEESRAIYRFSAPPPELQTTASDPFPYGFTWQGILTETSFSGEWYAYDYPSKNLSGQGNFTLERQP